MTSPVEQYIDWFKTLAVDQRLDVAALVGGLMPGSTITLHDTENLVDEFLDWIDKASTGGALKNSALALSLIAVTEFLIIRKRDNLQGWTETKAKLDNLAREHGNDSFADGAARMEFRGRQWVASCENWKKLRNGVLSEQSIETWANSMPIY